MRQPFASNDLTDRQRAILAFIAGFMREQSYPPTLREIGAAFGIRSPNGVVCHLCALERGGWITRAPRTSRAMRVVQPV